MNQPTSGFDPLEWGHEDRTNRAVVSENGEFHFNSENDDNALNLRISHLQTNPLMNHFLRRPLALHGFVIVYVIFYPGQSSLDHFKQGNDQQSTSSQESNGLV